MDILDVEQAAELTQKSVNTLYYYRHIGTGPKSFRLGRKLAYDRRDVDAWIAKQRAATERGG